MQVTVTTHSCLEQFKTCKAVWLYCEGYKKVTWKCYADFQFHKCIHCIFTVFLNAVFSDAFSSPVGSGRLSASELGPDPAKPPSIALHQPMSSAWSLNIPQKKPHLPFFTFFCCATQKEQPDFPRFCFSFLLHPRIIEIC